MTEITSDAVIGFAKQGHPQAIAVLLNRALVPKGAHVKVRQKKELLKVLINFLRDIELDQLVSLVQDTLNKLSPENVERVQIFTQRLGDRQASFQKEIIPVANLAPTNVAERPQNLKNDIPDVLHASRNVDKRDTVVQAETVVQDETVEESDALCSNSRYSVTEFLSQVSRVEELDVLKDHPFFTGVCPKCSHGYSNLDHPPLFWDCAACGWQDDLSQKVPTHRLRETPQRRKISQGKRLGSYLVESGLLTPAQIEVALADQQLAGVRLGEVLVRRGWIKEETVEYFMRKVVEPERQASTGQAEAYLESSRNLLKTLIENNLAQKESDESEVAHHVSSSDITPEEESPNTNTQPQQTPTINPINDKATLILSDVDHYLPRVSKDAMTAVNERETLLLPELEIHQLIDQESDS